MDGLLEVLVVDDGPDLAVVVGGPERGGHVGAGLTGVDPGKSVLACIRRQAFNINFNDRSHKTFDTVETFSHWTLLRLMRFHKYDS